MLRRVLRPVLTAAGAVALLVLTSAQVPLGNLPQAPGPLTSSTLFPVVLNGQTYDATLPQVLAGAVNLSPSLPQAGFINVTGNANVNNLLAGGNVQAFGSLSGASATVTGSITTGSLTASAITDTGLTPGSCVVAGTGGLLQNTTCGGGGSSITLVSAGSNIVVTGGSGPTVTVAATNAPTFTGKVTAGSVGVTGLATSAPVCTSAQTLATTGCNIAVIGTNKTAWTVQVAPTATALATPAAGFYSRAYKVSSDIANPTIDGSFGYCDVAGSGAGSNTFVWYESFGATPNFSTANPVSTTEAFNASNGGGGATFAPVALPTSTTAGNPTWLFAVVKSTTAVAPSGVCSFTLQGLQTIQ